MPIADCCRICRAIRREFEGLCVWALTDNDAACAFYRHLGGRQVCEGVEHFGDRSFRKAAFGWH
ncbi:hypothetical protein BMS3Bbin10_01818 [bacterium BMS3Bbin10]|nr:hypothetical protein BMS3Bbin10_01818 [bacterium BMS3Bbin10]